LRTKWGRYFQSPPSAVRTMCKHIRRGHSVFNPPSGKRRTRESPQGRRAI
jgi:hypothetical protein